MTTTRPTHQTLHRFTVFVLAVLVAAATAVKSASDANASVRAAASAGYQWPVRPFGQAHPVRANFGDPRTTFSGPPTPESLMTSGGIFQDHFGIDISVPDGTAVYAVRSGIASLKDACVVSVDSGGGFVAEYWHIIPTVRPGDHVTAYRTVLGHVMKGYEHVHFSELDDGRYVNPLSAGHLGPYDDHTKPTVGAISFRSGSLGTEELPEYVHGRVEIVASAFDLPSLPVPGKWADLPVAPARLTWSVRRAADGKVVVPETTAFDVRTSLPATEFWQHYARGTRQNMATFGTQRAWRTPGVYLYRLGDGFDTSRLATGIYRIVVTATDIRGNSGTGSQTFIIRHGSHL